MLVVSRMDKLSMVPLMKGVMKAWKMTDGSTRASWRVYLRRGPKSVEK